MKVRVVIGTYGDPSWKAKALVASASVAAQTVQTEVVRVHGRTLAEARNAGATPAGATHLIFLDADDQLEPHYVERMQAAVTPTIDLYQPATRGLYPDGRLDAMAVCIPARRSIREGNWLVIGTMVRREVFIDAGGFGEEPAWEDWALWARCMALGARWTPVPSAEYWVGVNPASRNQTAANNGQLFQQILDHNDRWAAERGVVIR